MHKVQLVRKVLTVLTVRKAQLVKTEPMDLTVPKALPVPKVQLVKAQAVAKSHDATRGRHVDTHA